MAEKQLFLRAHAGVHKSLTRWQLWRRHRVLQGFAMLRAWGCQGAPLRTRAGFDFAQPSARPFRPLAQHPAGFNPLFGLGIEAELAAIRWLSEIEATL